MKEAHQLAERSGRVSTSHRRVDRVLTVPHTTFYDCTGRFEELNLLDGVSLYRNKVCRITRLNLPNLVTKTHDVCRDGCRRLQAYRSALP